MPSSLYSIPVIENKYLQPNKIYVIDDPRRGKCLLIKSIWETIEFPAVVLDTKRKMLDDLANIVDESLTRLGLE